MKYLLLTLIFIIILYLAYNYFTSVENFTEDDFDVYVINMVSNKERLDNFMKEYNNSDLAFKKINVYPAIVGKDLDLTKYVSVNAHQQIIDTEKTGKRIHHYDLTRGAVGCYMSHLNVYKKIAASNKKFGLIFEDDVKIATDFYKRMLYGLNTVPDDWNIYLLGIVCLKCDIKNDYINVNRFWGLHGYLVKKETAALLVEKLSKLIKKQIDAEISLMIKNKQLKIYGINPLIVIQDGQKFKSDIQTPVENNIDAFDEEFNQTQLSNFYRKY
jgi:GR25 family glycosyltransferase involved in LPS biosynthesis